MNKSEIFTLSLHPEVGEEKDEAVDGEERAPDSGVSNPADLVACGGTNGDLAMESQSRSAWKRPPKTTECKRHPHPVTTPVPENLVGSTPRFCCSQG